MRRRRINFARLNYLLIPQSRHEVERLERSLLVRVLLRPLFALAAAFSREGHTLIVLGTLAAGLALDVQSTSGYILWSIIAGLLAAALVVRWFYPLDNVELRLEHAPRIAAGEPLSVSLLVTNTGQRAIEALRTRYTMMSWDGHWLGERPHASILEPGQTLRLTRQCRFDARGEKHAGPVGACILAPGGLSTGRPAYARDLRVTVLPRIAEVRQVSAVIRQRYQRGGVAMASSTGESMELIGVRPYRFGDPVRDLHARTWARMGSPHVREYQQEYFTRVGVILDTESHRTSELGEEASISLAAGVLAWFARSDTLIDLLVVGDSVHPITIGRSLGSLDHALELLALVKPGAPLAPDVLLARMQPHLDNLSAIVFITLAWDAARAALEHAIVAQGITCETVLVSDDDQPLHVPAQVVDAEAITAGEAIVL